MPFYDFFKSFLGIPNQRDAFSGDSSNNEERYDNRQNQYWEPRNESYEDIWREQYEEPGREGMPNDGMGFNIFTNPLEMHRYFEYQMNEMLKSFGGMFGHDQSDGFFGFTEPPQSNLPQLEPPPSTNLRDHYLRPGYESKREQGTSVRPDSDLDGKVNMDELDVLLKDKPQPEVTPAPGNRSGVIQAPQMRVFGQSITSKTIRNPDGTIETHRTVRDNTGNEETTITRQLGEKKYTVTTRTDREGRQERTEDMVNITEEELNRWQQPQAPLDTNKWFPFDKFFK